MHKIAKMDQSTTLKPKKGLLPSVENAGSSPALFPPFCFLQWSSFGMPCFPFRASFPLPDVTKVLLLLIKQIYYYTSKNMELGRCKLTHFKSLNWIWKPSVLATVRQSP
jgi:hypothetical protein